MRRGAVFFAALGALAWMLPSAAGPPAFLDITARSGIDFRNQSSPTSRKYLLESMTGGVAALDYNRDGLPDLYFVNGAALDDPMPKDKPPGKSAPRFWNRLYRNDGGGKFTDVTEAAGVRGHSYGMGAAAGDYDNDGYPDLYVTNYGQNILYHNNGDGSFRDVTAQAGVAGGGWSTGAAFVDFDRDGFLDLVVSRYIEWDFSLDIFCGDRRPGYRSYCHPDQFQPISHLLYRNNGNGTFADVSKPAGLASSPGKGLGIAIHDFDRDGWPDILIANDSFPQQLFRNDHGTFRETGLAQGLAYDEDGHTFAGMGADIADYDNDGWPDVFINALANQRYALFHNRSGWFEYVSGPAGISAATLLHSGWGARFLDYDNDGWKDLFVAQGHVMDNIELTQPALRYLEPLLLLRNVSGKFQDVSALAGPAFQVPLAARGVAFGDWNNDGFLDVAINCNNRPAVILQNSGAGGGHWLLVDLIGSASNRDGIGARLRLVSASGAEQHAFASAAGSYLSSSDRRVHFGLGKSTTVKLLEVTWPSGRLQRLENFPADRILTVREPEKP
ncbi:MAG: CRTAC1 family protein [Acidobacteria bacterium]|nr:CRTAC1 family protein [Acidobacteriota bacterium]